MKEMLIWYAAPAKKPPLIMYGIYFLVPTVPIIALVLLKKTTDHINFFVLGIVFVFAASMTHVLLAKTYWTWKDLGFRRDTYQKWYIYALVALLGTSWFFITGRFAPVHWHVDGKRLLLYSGLGVFVQELLYRSFLMKMSEELFKKIPLINLMCNIIFFIGMHCIFPHPLQKMLLVFPGAVTFTLLYWVYPNIVLVSVLHGVFNALAVLAGEFNV